MSTILSNTTNHFQYTSLFYADSSAYPPSSHSELDDTARYDVTTTTHHQQAWQDPYLTPPRPGKRRRILSPPSQQHSFSEWEESESDYEALSGIDSEEEGEGMLPDLAEKYRPFDRIPVECKERIMTHLDLKDLGRLQRVDKSFRDLLTLPHLYSDLAFLPFSPILHHSFFYLLPSILPAVQHLTLQSFSPALLERFLPSDPPLLSSRLLSLDLSFSSITDETLFSIGDEALMNLKTLVLKGCRGIRDFRAISRVLSSCENADLSWSGIEWLPSSEDERVLEEIATGDQIMEDDLTFEGGSDDSGFFEVEPSYAISPFATIMKQEAFPSLRHLSLSSCPKLGSSELSSFLSSLPSQILTLDLSHLNLSPSVLSSFRHHECGLKSINLVGNDQLTRSNVERLSRRLGKNVEVLHNAVLESDEVEDVRRFVELISGTLRRADAEVSSFES